MEDNLLNSNNEHFSLPEIDLSSIITLLEDIKTNQDKLIELNSSLSDYIIPTDEEIKQQQLEEKEKEQQQLEQQQIEQQQLEEKEQQQLEYNNELLSEIKLLNENITKVGYNTEYSNNQDYLFLICLIVIGFCVLTYKLLKRFFY